MPRTFHAEHAEKHWLCGFCEFCVERFPRFRTGGKQFNSMIQRDVDPLTGAHRDESLLSRPPSDPDSMEPDCNATVELERLA